MENHPILERVLSDSNISWCIFYRLKVAIFASLSRVVMSTNFGWSRSSRNWLPNDDWKFFAKVGVSQLAIVWDFSASDTWKWVIALLQFYLKG